MVKESRGRGFIVGLTENVPEHVWRTSLPAIAQTLTEIGPPG
jgi:hypothetical protein